MLKAKAGEFFISDWLRSRNTLEVLGICKSVLSPNFTLLVETFVDPSLFSGTCYRAAGWLKHGETRGYARHSGGLGGRGPR
jgi:hypothetical protein